MQQSDKCRRWSSFNTRRDLSGKCVYNEVDARKYAGLVPWLLSPDIRYLVQSLSESDQFRDMYNRNFQVCIFQGDFV